MKLFKNLDFDKLKKGLDKTRSKIAVRINETLSGKAQLDDATIEELEEILVTSDVGFDTAAYIIENTRENLVGEKNREQEGILRILKNELVGILDIPNSDGETEAEKISNYKPYIVLIVGVNGVGKTTTIGKLAHNYKMSGLNVLIGSADTFRAAANEQLDVWAKRAGVNIINSKSGADPSSVAFDTLIAAKNMNADVVLIDTAGRLHTKSNLMEELSKIKRVMAKVYEYAPNEIYLVLDANTGQNAIFQANEFKKYTDLTGFIITKLDGTAKGGVIFQLCMDKKIPIKYIGVGEGIEDLQNFDSACFVDALFGSDYIN
ncbi:signal recognition particle-docking protein FtsY [Bacteroidota bacterium]